MPEEKLKQNAKELQEKIDAAHPQLIINVDETGLDCKKDTEKLKVVLTHNCPCTYRSSQGEFHITLVLTIGITGWSLLILAIIKTISFVSDLKVMYNLPVNEWCYVTSSSSAYINNKLFSYWVDKILVPGVAARCRFLGFKDDTKALLILDGCLAHSIANLQALSKHSIDFHFLVPHSSHITQPLDQGIFSVFKRRFKSTHCYDTNNKVG